MKKQWICNTISHSTLQEEFSNVKQIKMKIHVLQNHFWELTLLCGYLPAIAEIVPKAEMWGLRISKQ